MTGLPTFRNCLEGEISSAPTTGVQARLQHLVGSRAKALDRGGGGKARFNVATPTNATVNVQHTYYRIIYKQNPFYIVTINLTKAEIAYNSSGSD